jgi:hypothetical protein
MNWSRIGTALRNAVRRAFAALRALPPRALRGADALRGDRGGHRKVRPPRGFAPSYGGGRARTTVPMHPRAETVFRNAALFLFNHLGLGASFRDSSGLSFPQPVIPARPPLSSCVRSDAIPSASKAATTVNARRPCAIVGRSIGAELMAAQQHAFSEPCSNLGREAVLPKARPRRRGQDAAAVRQAGDRQGCVLMSGDGESWAALRRRANALRFQGRRRGWP